MIKSLIIGFICVLLLFASWWGYRWFYYARTPSALNACINNLRQMDGAIQQWALENDKTTNAVVTWKDIAPYLGRGNQPVILTCPNGGRYSMTDVSSTPKCTLMHHNFNFGEVQVLDESLNPLAASDIQMVYRQRPIWKTNTTTNGHASIDDQVAFDAVCTNKWEAGVGWIIASKDGYFSQTNALPTSDWPIKFILRRKSE